HKYIPPVMEIVCEMPGSRIEGFIAAGHAATITGWGIFEAFVARHHVPVVIAGFEPLDILAALVRLVEMIRDRRAAVEDMFPRCVTRGGNLVVQRQLWQVFAAARGGWLIMTTDSHVIHPLVFPGGDIGRPAVAGTVNDLAMMGATEPIGLTSGVILEEGFPIDELIRIQASMRAACDEAETSIVAGDTKVMRRGEVDRLVINTSGVGMTHRVIRD